MAVVAPRIAIYFLIWWIVLFAVLPWGVRSQGEAATWRRAPIRARRRCPGLRSKLIWTTVVATVVFAICSVVYLKGWSRSTASRRLLGMPDF